MSVYTTFSFTGLNTNISKLCTLETNNFSRQLNLAYVLYPRAQIFGYQLNVAFTEAFKLEDNLFNCLK